MNPSTHRLGFIVDKLLSGIGTTLAERWVNLLALPGVLFTIVLAMAWWLHPVDPVDLDALARRLDSGRGCGTCPMPTNGP